MALEQNDLEERQVRLDAMIAEFRAAQQRRLVRVGKALWNQTERQLAAGISELPLMPN
jgi:hypothetical protein